MTSTLPEDQDKLLYEYNKLDKELKEDNLREKHLINLAVIAIITLLGVMITVLGLVRGTAIEYISPMESIIMTICALITALGYLRNDRWGFYLGGLTGTSIIIYITILHPAHDSYLITLSYALAVFFFGNSFGKKGFIMSVTIVTCMMIVLFVLFPGNRGLVAIVSQLQIVYLIGVMPMLLNHVSRLSKQSRQNELKAEILAMQNEELINTWKGYTKEQHSQDKKSDQKSTNSDDVDYASPYSQLTT